MENKVKEIMASIFEVDKDVINEASSPDTIEGWDSLRHMNLVTSLEEEFSIRFTDEQIGDMLNFKLVIHILKENGVS
jgi:acyl carrier protein